MMTGSESLRPDNQDAFEGMELENVIDMEWAARYMHEQGVRYDVLECMTAAEIVDFVVALAGVERPNQGANARVARELIIDQPVLARCAARAYDPELFDALQTYEHGTYTGVFNNYLHGVWLEPYRAEAETLERVKEAAAYQVGWRNKEAEWRAMRVRDTFGPDD